MAGDAFREFQKSFGGEGKAEERKKRRTAKAKEAEENKRKKAISASRTAKKGKFGRLFGR